MKSKHKYLAKRILVFILTLSILWSETSFVSLAQTIGIDGETTDNIQETAEEESSDESEAEITEITEEPAETGETVEPEEDADEPADDSVDEPADPEEPSEEPLEEPSEVPEDEEEPEFPETTESEQVEITYDEPEDGAGRFVIYIGDAAWTEGKEVSGDSVIRIFDKGVSEEGLEGSFLTSEDITAITWTASNEAANYSYIFDNGKEAELDLRKYFNPFDFNLTVEFTVGGTEYTLSVNDVKADETKDASGAGEDTLRVEKEDGVTYIFKKISESEAEFTGAIITDRKRFNGTLDIPETLDDDITVTSMEAGCLNNIYQGSLKVHAPKAVKIPETVTEIKGALVEDKNFSDLSKIIVADGNTVYAGDDNNSALYKKNGNTTELIEIASDYSGELLWRDDAVWTDDTYELDFSNITGFRCKLSEGKNKTTSGYAVKDRMLVKIDDNGKDITLIKVPNKVGTAVVIPEGITYITASALADTAVDTLILPASLNEGNGWDSGFTTARNIYVYSAPEAKPPVVSIDARVTGVTFYGFVDDKGNSALKEWVTSSANKSRKFKFAAMKTTGARTDYTVNTLRSPKSYKIGDEVVEVYEVYVGEKLSENFDFDIASKVINGYPGKTDVYVEIDAVEGSDFAHVADEFTAGYREDGSKYYVAENLGVAKVNIRKGEEEEDIIKTVYFAVRPDYCEAYYNNGADFSLGTQAEIYIRVYVNNKIFKDLTDGAIKEYEALGALKVVTPEVRNADGKDVWDIERTDSVSDGYIIYNVTTNLGRDSNGNVKGGECSDVIVELFGNSCSVYVDPTAYEYDYYLPNDGFSNLLIKKGETIEIPIMMKNWDDIFDSSKGEPVDFNINFGENKYQQVFCEVESGGKFVDAEIVEGQGEQAGKAVLRLTARENGKARVLVYMKYIYITGMELNVSVGENLVKSFTMNLWEGTENEQSIKSSIYSYVNLNKVYDLDEIDSESNGKVWEKVIPVSEVKDSENKTIPSGKLKWTVSDAGVATLVKGDAKDKNRVTGIKLNGEGTVLITVSVNDVNAASVKMMFTVKNMKPRLYNGNASLDINRVNGTAEYAFAVPEGVKVEKAEIGEVSLKNVKVDSNVFDISCDKGKVFVSIAEDTEKIPAAGEYKLNLNVSTSVVTGDGDDTAETVSNEYTYSVTLKLTGTAPKVTVTAESALDLSIPAKRESALTVKVGDVVNGENTEIKLNTGDYTTLIFAKYFTLKRNNDGQYSIEFVKNGSFGTGENAFEGVSAADIAKSFNNKKIKLTVNSDDYRNCPKTAEVTIKMIATAPVIKVNGSGKISVNTGDYMDYDWGTTSYYAGTSYTLTDGFELLSDGMSMSYYKLITMKIAEKQAAYQDMFYFVAANNKITVHLIPGVPKGTYTFTWIPKVKASGDNIYKPYELKPQKITVVVTASAAKAALSSTKLVVNRNYKNMPAEASLQFDENQIQNLYGFSDRVDCYDDEHTGLSVTLVKAPKGVTPENSLVKISVNDGRITAKVEEVVVTNEDGTTELKQAALGEYKYSITPCVQVKYNEGSIDIISLAPINFSVQVTEDKPTASLSQTTVTIDNNDLSTRAYIKLNIKGNYQYVVKPEESKIEIPANGPAVCLEGDYIRVEAKESTLKGTYKIKVTPTVSLDSKYDDDNPVDLTPVMLTVKVNSTRPALKLEKSKLTVSSVYPGVVDEDGAVNAPAEAITGIGTGNGDVIGTIEAVAADNKTKALGDNAIAIKLIYRCDDKSDYVTRLAAIPGIGTPNGTYNYLVYVKLYAADDDGNETEGAALEPVKLSVTVNNAKPSLKLSASSILLPANRSGRVNITLQGQTDCAKAVEVKTEYLVIENGTLKLVAASTEDDKKPDEAEIPDDALAVLETSEDGELTVTSLGNGTAVSKKTVDYKQTVTLHGNDEPYTAAYKLTFNLTTAEPKAVLSANTITLNKNFDADVQGNQVILTLNDGEKIVKCGVTDSNTGAKKDVISFNVGGIGDNETSAAVTCSAFFKTDDLSKVAKGKYKFKLTPYIADAGADEGQKALSSVDLTVEVTDALPTVSASRTKVTLNRMDQRADAGQYITLVPNQHYYADYTYTFSVTKGPKGVDLTNIDFVKNEFHETYWWESIQLRVTDTSIPDGTYTLTVTPSVTVKDKTAKLKNIDISVTVVSPKVTAAVQAPKVTVDLATAGTVYMRNSIILTGTNAEAVTNIKWKAELTKKPNSAGDNEIWIEDAAWSEDEETDGKEFHICWGDKKGDNNNVNVTPGTYEFTIMPTELSTWDKNLSVPTPGAMKLTVTVKNSMPTVKYDKTTSKMNLNFVDNDNIFITLSDTSWHLEDVDAVMTSWPKNAGEEAKSGLWIDFEGNRLRVRGSEKVKEGTYTFTLAPKAGKNGIIMSLKEQKYTVTVKNEVPTAKVSSGKLTCNVLYTGAYNFGDADFNKKQQTKLTLNKNLSSSCFEDIKIAFTGKAAQQSDADKIEWNWNNDGTVQARLRKGSVANTGSYSFEVTPIIRCDTTNIRMTLKPVKITVVVENKAIKATAKASGKIDLLNPESEITYTVSLSDKDADAIEKISLVASEKGEDWTGYFYMVKNNREECTIINSGMSWQLSTKVNYEMRLKVETLYGKTYYAPIKIKLTQSKVTAKANLSAVTLYKQSSSDTAAIVEIKTTVNNEQIDIRNNVYFISGNSDFTVESVYDLNEDSDSVKVRIMFDPDSEEAKSKYKTGSKVKLPIYVNLFGQSGDSYNTVKVVVTVNIKN